MQKKINGSDSSPQQQSEEREFLIKQKFLLEDILLDLNKIRIHPFNLFNVIKHLRKVMLIIGAGLNSCLIKIHSLHQNESDLCKSVESLQQEIVSLHERIKKLEGDR